MDNNEITLKLNCSANEFSKILEFKGFKKVKRFILDDTYFVPNYINIKALSSREILRKCIIIRDITDFKPFDFKESKKILKLTYKMKNINENGDIVSQENINCGINSIKEGNNFLKAIGYKELMNIIEYDTIYELDNFEIAIKDIKNSETLIEIETSEEYNTINKLKQKINDLELPVDKSNFFVKKAEIELEKIL